MCRIGEQPNSTSCGATSPQAVKVAAQLIVRKRTNAGFIGSCVRSALGRREPINNQLENCDANVQEIRNVGRSKGRVETRRQGKCQVRGKPKRLVREVSFHQSRQVRRRQALDIRSQEMANQTQNQGNQGGKSGNQGGQSSRGGQNEEQGFAAMDPEQQREIARKGGEAVSEDRDHMSEIGRKGGEASAESRGSSERSQSSSSRSSERDDEQSSSGRGESGSRSSDSDEGRSRGGNRNS
jgi:general stress protein YciG